MTASTPVRRYVPQQIDLADWSKLSPMYNDLLDRPIGSAGELERWLLDFSELTAAVDEYGSRRYIEKSCHTDDAEIEKAFLHFVENIEPETKPVSFKLQKKFLESPYRAELSDRRYFILGRQWQAEVDVYRDENVALETESTKLINEYDKLSGAMMVSFRGQEYTLQQIGKFLEQTDRPTREEAWKLSSSRRLVDRERLEEIFDALLVIRQKIALNADCSDYRAYMWKSLKRFDYTPEDCLRFADAIAEACVPLVAELDRERREDMKIEALRPWDTAVDPKGRSPLHPFDEKQVDVFVDKVKEIFSRLSPQLAEQFESLRSRDNLDLASRKGKQPGGYQSTLEEVKEPFIFMNSAGLQRDVETLLHEGGHAFHAIAAGDEPLVFLRHAPMEFCEVASMSMELLGSDHFNVFYNEADAARAKRTLLEGIIRFLPWMTTIDSFQHWIYTHPGHSREERKAEWLRLLNRFSSKLDWSGHEATRESMWQKQLHLYHVPFYYIEYGIAQLGALQLWMKSREDTRRALANYRAGLKLGGTRPLPELFAAAGIAFDVSERTLRPLMTAVGEELERLPR